MIIEVTAADLATPDPLGAAFERVIGRKVIVRGDRVYSYTPDESFHCFLPLDVQTLAFEHARGRTVEPFSFEVRDA